MRGSREKRVRDRRGPNRQTARASRPLTRSDRHPPVDESGSGGHTPQTLKDRLTALTKILDPLQKLVGAVPGVIGGLLWVTHGLQRVIGDNALSTWVDSHPLSLLLLVVLPILFSVAAVGVGVALSRRHSLVTTAVPAHLPLLIGTSTLSIVSTLLLSTVLLEIAVRPPGCPATLCPQVPGPHDQYLEAELTAIQSSAYLIPNSPSQYSLDRLPASTGERAIAVYPTTAEPDGVVDSPYRVVIRVHSLQRGQFGMFIESVTLAVRKVKSVPQPLHVWMKNATLSYAANPYQGTYAGEAAGADVATVYAGAVPHAHVQLAPGESDELGIALTSRPESDLQFQVKVGYRVSSEQGVRTLALPYTFEVVFSHSFKWQRYRLQAGSFRPA